MSDTLRDRIVAAIAAAGEQPDADVLSMTDAVIAELGLREEMRYRGTFSFTPPQRRRYVTDWMTDE